MMKKYLLTFMFITSISYNLVAQQHVTLDSYNQNTVTANGSITLLPGFSVSSGNKFHAFITTDDVGVPNMYSPNRNLNYVLTHSIRKPGIQNPSDSTNLNSHVNTSIMYVDAWGREAANIDVKASALNKNLMHFREYDDLGLETTNYLPYSILGNGSILPNISDQLEFYNSQPNVVHTPYPYAQTRFEESNLRRVREKGWAGDAWQLSTATSPNKGHTIRYNLNTHRREALYKVDIDANGNPSLMRTNNNALYPIDALQRIAFQDENSNNNGSLAGNILECKDRNERIVVSRKYNNNGNTVDTLSTYYVYDDFGNLSFVLPPAANPDNDGAISQNTLDSYCYQYKYDGRQRVKAKKLPGKGWQFIVYSKLDQPILTQDSLQRMKSPQQWSVIKYDAYGRPIINAIFNSGELTSGKNCLNNIQSSADTSLTLWESKSDTGVGYTSLTYPSTNLSILAIHYFDNYNIPDLPTGVVYNQSSNFTTMTSGLPTASKIKVDGISHYLWTINYYDDESQVVKTIKQHYKGGSTTDNNYDEITNTYDFTGLTIEKIRRHYVSGIENLFIKNSYKYDAWGRIVDTYQTTSKSANPSQNIPVLLSRIEYNEIGQVSRKRLHSTNLGSTFAQDISYTYNERGWLKSEVSPLFNLALHYESNITGTTPQFNGNISRQEWSTGKYYNYSYDRINRLINGISDNGNNEEISYNNMGNINTLQRKIANSIVDQLVYNYSGSNKLASVTDNSNDLLAIYQLPGTTGFNYDGNGSVTSRINGSSITNNIASITYNDMNLPSLLTVGNKQLSYIYDAMGTKLRKTYNISSSDYIDGIIYNDNNLSSVETSEGRAVMIPSSIDPIFSYEYTISDHLGNGRVYFDIYQGLARKVQELNYFPFGKPIAIGSIPSNENLFQYNGKEKQSEIGMFDYGARFYDPIIGRWHVVDPLAEDYSDVSPYNYVLNNPINYTDPDGTWVNDEPASFRSTVVDSRGKIIDHKNDGDNFIYQIVNDRRIKIGSEISGLNYTNLIGQTLNPLLYDANPISLKELVVNAKKKPNTAFGAIALGLSLRTGVAWAAEGADPEPATKTIGGIALAAYSAYIIADEATKYYYDSNKAGNLEQRILEMAHKPKKQSTGNTGGDRHDKQYTHGGKNRPVNKNQRKGAEKRKNVAKEEN